MDKNYIGAGSNLLILGLINKKDCYGYEIIRDLEILSENTFQFKEGTLYPILHKFESLGFVTSYFKRENNKERKYYRITDKGRKQIVSEKESFELFKEKMDQVVGTFNYEFNL
jgi:DNA-binding PadR family transcriptional regulator